ncbi:MAG: hypothetical protein K8S23_14520 [Candidatus Cloacimonetes bacterium]|nr:hypothetical protein [Candidatus Cloacimonadota bacterium]
MCYKNLILLILFCIILQMLSSYSFNYENYKKKFSEINSVVGESKEIEGGRFNYIDIVTYYYIMENIECDFQRLEDFRKDFKINLNDKLSSGKIIIPISRFTHNSITYLIAISKNNDELVIISQSDIADKIFSFKYYSDSVIHINKLTEDEFLMSCFLNVTTFTKIENNEKYQRFILFLNNNISSLNDTKEYQIYSNNYISNQPNTHQMDIIAGYSLKKIHNFIKMSNFIEKRPPNYFDLLKEIANDKTIPSKYRKDYISSLLYNYFGENTDNISLKGEYFNYILKVVNEYPKESYSGYESNSQIDQLAMYSIYSSFDDNVITLNEFFDISNKIIKINKNPAVTLLAYSAVVRYYLLTNNFDAAFQTAVESIKRYNQPVLWICYKTPRYYNAIPTVVFINYFYENQIIPPNLLVFLEELKIASVEHEEVVNFLNFCIAREKEFSNYSNENVLTAYKNINVQSENIYEFSKPSGSGSFGDFFLWRLKNKVTDLENMESYTMTTTSDSVKVKLHIIDKKEDVLYLPKGQELIILQETPDCLKKNNEKNNIYYSWCKANIDGKVYWVNTEYLD